MFHKHKSSTIKLNSNIDICFLQHKTRNTENIIIYTTYYKVFIQYKKKNIIITPETKK